MLPIIRYLLLCCTLMPGLLFALTFELPPEGSDLVGNVIQTTSRYKDTLSDLARANDLGYTEITSANPNIDPWLPGEGSQIVLPKRFILPAGPRRGLVINLAELRLYYYPPNSNQVITYPLGIGREGWSTPEGKARITRKKEHPSWRPPKSIRAIATKEGHSLPRVVPPGPNNPLGSHALYLSLPGYLIHGTNKPYGVGMRVSHGCIRLYPEDIRRLFKQVPSNTPVRIINQPYKVGWSDGALFIEAHAPLTEQRKSMGNSLTPMVRSVIKATQGRKLQPDWKALQTAASQALGIPVSIGLETPTRHTTIRSPRQRLVLSDQLEKDSHAK